MRKFLCIVMACVSVIGCLCINAGAVGRMDIVSEGYEEKADTITRATGSFSMSIGPYKKTAADTAFPLSARETVRIRATYEPEDASMDFGLIDPDGVFHYINVTTGSIDETIEVPDSGNYTLGIRNNSGNTVKVSGFVRY